MDLCIIFEGSRQPWIFASETWVSSVATKMVQSFVIVYSINMKRYDQECVG